MKPSEIRKEAESVNVNMNLVKPIIEKYTKDWETGKNEFKLGIIATLDFIERKKL